MTTKDKNGSRGAAGGGEVSAPYAFMWNEDAGFFDEGSEAPSDQVDLMKFSYDDDHSFGMLDLIVRTARRVLADVSPSFPRAALWFGDELLRLILKDRATLISGGKKVYFKDLDFKSLNQIELLHPVLSLFGDYEIILGDEENGVEGDRITQERFCASYALRMTFNAIRYIDGELRDYYLMQAAAAFGLMQSTRPVDKHSIAGAIAGALKKEAAKRAAKARWGRSDAGAVRKSIYDEWTLWQQERNRYRWPRDFRRAMQMRFPDMVDGTLKNWMSAWGKGRKES